MVNARLYQMDLDDVAKLSNLLFYCWWALPLFFPIRGHSFGLGLPPQSDLPEAMCHVGGIAEFRTMLVLFPGWSSFY